LTDRVRKEEVLHKVKEGRNLMNWSKAALATAFYNTSLKGR
jgi:hypothetical protein